MPVDHSVFKQTVLNVSAHQLQQHTIEIILYRRQNGLSARHDVGQLRHVSFIVFQHSTSHMMIHWHIHTVHLLLFLHKNCSLVIGSLRKLYF